MLNKYKKSLACFMSAVLSISCIGYFSVNNKIDVLADGAMTGNPWGSGTSGNIILTKQTVLRLGFDVRELGSYRDYGYENCYPSVYKGYSIILGTCGNTYSGSSYSNNVILAPTADNTGVIDYVQATNMFLNHPDSSLESAIWDMTMGGISNYTGDGVTALNTGKTINLDEYLSAETANDIRLRAGSDWNTAKFHEEIQWKTPLNQNPEMKDNAMAMVLIAEYLNRRGADINTKEIYNYYTRQSSEHDYILVLENFHGAMKSSDKQPFFTHQNYIFDTVTGYHVANYARAGTIADWFNSVKDIQAQPINLTYSNGNLTELYATGNGNNPTRQLFCHFFASKGGKLVGNRMALSAYFYRKALENSELSEEVLKQLTKDDPLKFWYTKQYDEHSNLGDSWASDFTRYKTGFAVFKAVPPITTSMQKPTEAEPKGGHTIIATPTSQEVKRFTKLSSNNSVIKTDITLTPNDIELDSLANTVYSLLYNWTSFEGNKFTMYDQNYTANYLNDRRLIFESANWELNFSGDEIIESKISGDKDNLSGNSIASKTTLGKGKNYDLIIYQSEINGQSKEEKISNIKSILAQKLAGYKLSKNSSDNYITMHDGKFDSVGTFNWNFNSIVTVNMQLEDKFTFPTNGRTEEEIRKNKYAETTFEYSDSNGVQGSKVIKLEGVSIDKKFWFTDWKPSLTAFKSSEDTNGKINLNVSNGYLVDFGKSSTLVTFNVIENPVVSYRWKNNPKGFAEVKHKIYSDNRSTEKWEVMQGIPTTEDLYINVGGTPYYVDIIADYKTMKFSKDFSMPYVTTSHEKTEGGGYRHTHSETSYDELTKNFSASYFVINNITIKPCDKAIITPNKTLFENGNAIEVDFMNDLSAKVIIDSSCGSYYTDNYGDDENKFSYGITKVPENTLVKRFSHFTQGCTKCDSDTEKHKEHFNDELNNLNVFVNSPGVRLEVYNAGKLLTSYEILKPYSYSAPLLEADNSKLVTDTTLWQPALWDDEYELIPFQGYTGQPDLETGRNKENEFYGKQDILMNKVAENGLYEMPYKKSNENYNDEIEAGYDSLADAYISYLNLGNAMELGQGICINSTSVPDIYPVPLNYTDNLKYPNEKEGINPIIVHNPITIQDVSIATSALTEQRIGYDNPLGKSGNIPRLDINDYFNLYTPTDGALIRNYELDKSNVGSTNKNCSSCFNRGLLLSEMYKVWQSGNGLQNGGQGALGRGYNGITPDIINPIPSLETIRESGNYMDTKMWTAYKFVQFPFAVIINPDNNAEYVSSGTWISIPIVNTITKFVIAGSQKDLNAVNVKIYCYSN